METVNYKTARLVDEVETYRVVIKREGEMFVARDDSGTWRAKGTFAELPTINHIAEYLFHADEIKSVDQCEEGIEVFIFSW